MLWSRPLWVGALVVSSKSNRGAKKKKNHSPHSHYYSTPTSLHPTKFRGGALSAQNKNTDSSSQRVTFSLLATSASPSTSLRLFASPSSTSSSASAVLSSSTSSHSFDQYHLLWSPHAWKKLVGTVVFLSILPSVQSVLPQLSKLPQLPRLATTTSWLSHNWILPLAASSCCLLQLGLNLLSVGCAGWNSYLGPVRPYFMGLLLVASIRHTPSPTALAWRAAVALLPEVLDLYNWWRQTTTATSSTTSSTSYDDTALDSDEYELHFNVPTMGCVACINAIDSAVRQVPGVRQVRSQLVQDAPKGGTVTVRVATQDPTALSRQVVAAVADAGFGGAVLVTTTMTATTNTTSLETTPPE